MDGWVWMLGNRRSGKVGICLCVVVVVVVNSVCGGEVEGKVWMYGLHVCGVWSIGCA